MKFLTLLAAAMVSVAVADDRGVCKDWHPTIFNRINAFCLKTDIVVPSNYAEKGAGTNPTGRVWITKVGILNGIGCNPPQWVPTGICRRQFYSECASHKMKAYYGRLSCQGWYIQYAPGATKPVKGSDGSTWYVPMKKREALPEAMAEPEAEAEVKMYATKEEAEAAGLAAHEAEEKKARKAKKARRAMM
ncbi:hypothetical protein SMMN14_07901 [Sphaerulina musiva]